MKPVIRYTIMGHDTAQWRPWPLKSLSLSLFAVLCLLLAIIVEIALSVCEPNGCPLIGTAVPSITAYSTANPPPKATLFVYNFLPTMFGVGFGLLCVVIHHDCMRMEPWFQLSKPGGALAEEGLLLEYSYMFPPLVLYRAVKKGHFPVVASSSILFVTSLIITPLTAGVFESTMIPLLVSQNITYPMVRWNIPVEEFVPTHGSFPALFAGTYFHPPYSHAWLNSSLPPFMTEDYALEGWSPKPVYSSLGSENKTAEGKENISSHPWTGPTILYEADLECEEAIANPISDNGTGVSRYILTSKSKAFPSAVWEPSLFDIRIERYYTETSQSKSEKEYYGYVEVLTQRSLEDNITTISHSDILDYSMYNSVLYVWGLVQREGNDTTTNPEWRPWTAIFCGPRYYKSHVNATVLMPSGVVQNISEKYDRSPLDAIANTTTLSYLAHFFSSYHQDYTSTAEVGSTRTGEFKDSNGYVIGLGFASGGRGASHLQLLHRFGGTTEFPRIRAYPSGAGHWQNNALLFALSSQSNSTLENLFDPDALAAMYRSAFKIHFASLCRVELGLVRRQSDNESGMITSQFTVRVFKANERWCRGTQAALFTVAILAIYILLLMKDRRCYLDGEPNSLASALGILDRSAELTSHLEESEFQSMTTVRSILALRMALYQLVLEPNIGPRIEVKNQSGDPILGIPVPDKREPRRPEVWPISFHSGLSFVIFFVSMTTLASALYASSKVNDGITFPGKENTFVYNILFSYLPTLLGIIVEPLLTTLGSYYSMFGPYMSLLHGHAKSERSLSVDYDKSPPHFQVLRALRSRDLTLGALALAILLSQVLAVALGGVFYPMTSQSSITVLLESLGKPIVKDGYDGSRDFMDVHYVLDGILSGTIKRLTWTTEDRYILPFSLTTGSGIRTVTATTLGLHAGTHCSHVPVEKIIVTCYIYNLELGPFLPQPCPALDTTDENFFGLYIPEDPCWPTATPQELPLILGGSESDHYTRISSELPAADFLTPSPQCSGTLFAAWGETPPDPNNDRPSSYIPRVDISVLRCILNPSTVGLSTTVDLEGHVLEGRNVEPLPLWATGSTYLEGSDILTSTFISMIVDASVRSSGMNWESSHMISLHPDIVQRRRNITRIPRPDILPHAFEDTINRLYAIWFRLYADDLLQYEGAPKTIEAEGMVLREKVAVSTPMFAIIVGILGYSTIVIIFLYWGPQGERRVGHLPTCLAGMWAHLYASDAKELCGNISGPTMEERLEKLNTFETRFKYGKFTGKDGDLHYGISIEREDLDGYQDGGGD